MLLGMKSVKLRVQPIGRAVPYMTSNTRPKGVVTYSTVYGSYSAHHAFDASLSSKWSASAGAYRAWITYKFSSITKVGSFRFRASSSTRSPKDYTVQVSDNGVNWTTVLTVRNEVTVAGKYTQLYVFDKPVKCRYIKMNTTATRTTRFGVELLDIEYIEYS